MNWNQGGVSKGDQQGTDRNSMRENEERSQESQLRQTSHEGW